MNALIVLVYYVVAAALFLFGCAWEKKALIPEQLQLPLILILMAYGLVMAAWVAFRSIRVPAATDAETLKRAVESIEVFLKSSKPTDSKGG